MNILFLTDNFPPEVNASASRVFERACYWVQWGHQVTVITSHPNFPDGKLLAPYKNQWYYKEIIAGITVIRVKTFIAKNEGFFLRTLDFLSYMMMAFFVGIFQKNVDIVMATSPQLFTAVGGYGVASLKRKPFIFELGDLWPASIQGVGAIKNKPILNALEKVELFLYRHSAHVVALTQAFKENLIHRNIPAKKITTVLNGVDLSRFSPQPKDTSLLENSDLQNRFIIGYLGTHGLAHGLENVLRCAKQLKDHPDIVFLLAGSGAEKQKLQQLAQEWQLNNVVFLPSQPKDRMPALWSICDIALVHLKNEPVFTTVIPSKIFEAMGMGLPILLCSPHGEAAKIIEMTQAGIWIDPEKPTLLADTILQLKADTTYRQQLAQQSYAARIQFTREQQARHVIEILAGSLLK